VVVKTYVLVTSRRELFGSQYSNQKCTKAAPSGAVKKAGEETSQEQAVPVRLAGAQKNVRIKCKCNKLSKTQN